MASMANRDDEYDDVDLPKMTLTQRPKGYRKTKKIHSMKKGSKLRTNYQPIAFAKSPPLFFYFTQQKQLKTLSVPFYFHTNF